MAVSTLPVSELCTGHLCLPSGRQTESLGKRGEEVLFFTLFLGIFCILYQRCILKLKEERGRQMDGWPVEGILYREMIKCRQKVGEALLNYRSTLKQYHVLVYIIQISALLYNYLLICPSYWAQSSLKTYPLVWPWHLAHYLTHSRDLTLTGCFEWANKWMDEKFPSRNRDKIS